MNENPKGASNAEVASNPQQARMIPDVSMVADNLLVYASVLQYAAVNPTSTSVFDPIQTCGQGTSAAAPLWAGVAALVNQQSVFGRLGFANPQLYALAANPDSYAANFHDVADNSNNSYPSADGGVAGTGGYHAVKGYDLATGLGSPQCPLLTTLATTCVPGTTRCTSGTEQETCNAGGQWDPLTLKTCDSGVCSGSTCLTCVPESSQCVPNGAMCVDGVDTCNGVETCDANGDAWGPVATCETQQYPAGCITQYSPGSTTHSNGTGQIFTDCSPADNYTQNAATEACAALTGSGNISGVYICHNCSGNGPLGPYGYVEVTYNSTYYQWQYEGIYTGSVFTCPGPGPGGGGCGYDCPTNPTPSGWD